MRTHSLYACVCLSLLCYCLCVCTVENHLLYLSDFVFGHTYTHVFMHVHACVWVCLDLYINQQGLMLFPSAGWALPSHYTGSRTNHRLRVSVSPNLSLFSLLSLVIFLFHSLRQLPSPTCPQSTLITFSSHMYSISLALLSISLLFFSPSYLSQSSVLPPPVSSHSLRSPPCWLHIVSCCVFFFSLSLSFSLVKDLDTEKYVHLVSRSS